MTITHSFVSAKSDGGDATLVRPSDWNADHIGTENLSGTAGARPAAGTAGRTYFATDTKELSRDNGSSWDYVTGGVKPFAMFGLPGTVVTGTGQQRVYNDTGRTLTIVSTRASIGTPPTGATLIVDVNVGGTTIFTTQSNRPTIAISGFTNEGGTPDVTTITDGSYLTVDIDQIGSTVAGADLTVAIWVVG